MPTTLSALEIIDTAVKIGLGALIAGAASILLARQNHSMELKRLQFTRRLDAIEKTSDVLNKHFSIWATYSEVIAAAYDHILPPNSTFGKEEWKYIHKADDAFITHLSELREAAARLRLLGEAATFKCINAYIDGIADFRNNLIIKERTPPPDEHKEIMKVVGRLRKEIYESLSQAYLRIPR